MIEIPFTRNKFSDEAKQRLSGINVSLEYDNIESGLFKTSLVICEEVIGRETYLQLIETYKKVNGTNTVCIALDYMQRGILHLTLFNNLIYMMVRIGNDGITTKKTNDETTIFKYQQDELSNNLINTAWFWLSKLIFTLNEHPKDFPQWAASEHKKELDELPLSIQDFKKWVGVDNLYFFSRIKSIIREVWMDYLEPRVPEQLLSEIKEKVSRAAVYSVMEIATQRLPYAELPEPVRKDIDNEQSKTNKDKAETHIREVVSSQFANKAKRYWMEIEEYITIKRRRETGENNSEYTPSQDDKFIYT